MEVLLNSSRLVWAAALAVCIFWMGYWLLHVIAICHGKWKLHRRTCSLPRETPYPGVSVLKPLVGVDPNLFSNLESFFKMNYPVFELLFCVSDESDPSLMLVKRLREKYPQVDTSLFIGGMKVGVNPKVNNLQPGYLAAKYDLVLISDSGIRMKEDTLMDMVNHMDDNVGLVHQMPFACDRKGFASVLEQIYFGTAHARIYLSADLFRLNCATGMSSLLRKTIIEEAGGLKAFGCYLAEDYFLAKAVMDRGYRLRVCQQPAWQNSGVCEVGAFQTRMTRWAKLRFAMVPTTMLLEPVSECMVQGLLASWATSLIFRWDPVVVFLVHVACWFILDWILISIVQNGSLPCNELEYLVGWLFRECGAPFLFARALWEPTIQWKTGRYRLRWGGVAEQIEHKAEK